MFGDKKLTAPANRAEIAKFATQIAQTPRHPPQGERKKLVFALDATMSRQPSWDLAQKLQTEMFLAAAALGGLDLQLVYFRGFSECRASKFFQDGAGLAGAMSKISVAAGSTQIERVLKHVAAEARAAAPEAPLRAFIYIGDAVEESADALAARAGELGLRGIKGFFFLEGGDAVARQNFVELARLTGGAFAGFDRSAPDRLAALLRAAALYAAGGLAALRGSNEPAARLLLTQMD